MPESTAAWVLDNKLSIRHSWLKKVAMFSCNNENVLADCLCNRFFPIHFGKVLPFF